MIRILSLIAASILNFTALFLVLMKAITGPQQKHNARRNILTGVKLS